jgi:phage major head subunit gpT-like protein
MTVMNSSNLSYAVDEAVTELVFAELFEADLLWPSLYNVRSSTGKQEVLASFGELGLFEARDPGARFNTDEIKQQFKKTFVHTSYGKILEIDREWVDDSDWPTFENLSMQLGQKAAETLENAAVIPFNDAFDGALVTCEDALSLCNSAHVNVDSGNSQSNTGTNAIGWDGAKTTRIAMRGWTGYDSAQVLATVPDEILVPSELEEEGFALLSSEKQPDTNNNNRNIFYGRYKLYVWDWLTDANAWFMMDSRRRRLYLHWFQRVLLEVYADNDWKQQVRSIGGYMRFVNGSTNWRFIYGNNPS